MRSSWRGFVAAAGGLLVAPQLAVGDEVQEQLRQMQDRLTQLEDQLTETSRELEVSKQQVQRQQATMQDAGLGEGRALSSLSSFLEQVEIGGWVAASYWFNTNDPDFSPHGGENTGSFGGANPFHPDHNTFQVDQVWFEMFKPATEESRAGFGIDIVYGKTADANLRGADSTNGDLPAVYQAYVEWLAPIGPGLNIKAGRFATFIGVEVAQSIYNFNVTRGLIYNLLQPFNHVGALASMEFDNGLDFAVGIANTAVGNVNSDTDDDKAFLWRVGYGADTWSIGLNGLYGGDSVVGDGGATARDGDKTGIVDLVVTWDPSERLSMYFNGDYLWLHDSNDGSSAKVDAWGMAAAGRYAITERTGFAIRGEYLRSNDAYIFGGGGPPGFLGAAANGFDQDLWTITGTLDHLLTDNLTIRAEVRYEEGHADSGVSDSIFYFDSEETDLASEQVLLGVEMYYRF